MVWCFVRDGERLTWEVRQSGTRYELALRRPDGLEVVYHSDTPAELIESVRKVPRALLKEGWRPRI